MADNEFRRNQSYQKDVKKNWVCSFRLQKEVAVKKRRTKNKILFFYIFWGSYIYWSRGTGCNTVPVPTATTQRKNRKIPMHFHPLGGWVDGAGWWGSGNCFIHPFSRFYFAIKHLTQLNPITSTEPFEPFVPKNVLSIFRLWCALRTACLCCAFLHIYVYSILLERNHMRFCCWCCRRRFDTIKPNSTRRKAIKMFNKKENEIRMIHVRIKRIPICMCVGFYAMRSTRQINSSFKSVSNWVNVNFILIEFFVSVNSSRIYVSYVYVCTVQKYVSVDVCGSCVCDKHLLWCSKSVC